MADNLRRGFKTEANNWARDLRAELGIDPSSPLCPWELANFLQVPIINASSVVDAEIAGFLASKKGQKEFSAMVCFAGCTAMIFVNDAHSRKRLASDIAHELAHILLRHPPADLFSSDGTRQYNDTAEEEANWLGPALLISEEAAIEVFSLIQRGQTNLQAFSDGCQISEQVIQMRMNVVGARKRVRFAAE